MTTPRRVARGFVLVLAVVAAVVQVGPGASTVHAMEPSAVRALASSLAGLAAPRSGVLLAHGSRNRKVVALTFDDGYNSAACSALVDELMATATPATFFPNAVYGAGSPTLWRRVAALGFPIGNHSTHHPLMTRLPFAAQYSEIASDRAIADRVLGQPTLSVFRPPFGAWNGTTLAAAGAAGYPIVLNWDVTFADSSRRPDGTPWPTSSYVRAASRGTNGSVILGHCGSRIDVAALPSVIAAYRSRGFTFVTVPELLGLPGARSMHFPTPPPVTPPSPPPPPREADPRKR
jgi:peptidoglycan/xylan/chitin deacetylase (PgdA/CDA1 family)